MLKAIKFISKKYSVQIFHENLIAFKPATTQGIVTFSEKTRLFISLSTFFDLRKPYLDNFFIVESRLVSSKRFI